MKRGGNLVTCWLRVARWYTTPIDKVVCRKSFGRGLCLWIWEWEHLGIRLNFSRWRHALGLHQIRITRLPIFSSGLQCCHIAHCDARLIDCIMFFYPSFSLDLLFYGKATKNTHTHAGARGIENNGVWCVDAVKFISGCEMTLADPGTIDQTVEAAPGS